MNSDALRARATVLLDQAGRIEAGNLGRPNAEVHEVFQGALNVALAFWGPDSPRMKPLLTWAESSGSIGTDWHFDLAVSTLRTVQAEIDAGFVGSLRLDLTGAVLADLVHLAREHLGEGDGGKDVAAVLASAAYEDAIRRLGRERAGVADRPRLQAVLDKLREADVLAESQFTIAQSHLKFRNDALHADWEKIERASVATVLAFVDELILKHFH